MSPATNSLTAYGVSELDVLLRTRALEHDLRGAELVAAVHDVTFSANLERKIASSMAESPPPTMTVWASRKKAASQVAQ